MAPSSKALAFVTDINKADGGVIVTDRPKLDLDLYIQNYSGRTRFDRLVVIGICCVPLCIEALKAAVVEAKKGSDVSRYKEAWNYIHNAAPDEPEAQRDDDWIEKTEWANKAETNRLETELKGYRNNLIKESIRIGHQDLGTHFENIGKLTEAADVYSRMRQDVSTTKHIIDCAMHLASVALQRRDWTMTLNNMSKITGAQSSDDKTLQPYTKIVSGISHLGLGNFIEAARAFLQTDFATSPATYDTVATPNDVAIYGGLLALATMDRKELQTKVLDNQSFRTFLEHEPHIRKAISLFVTGRYSQCLSILESSRADYMLDVYLQKHVNDIYSRIRSKCIVQYFVPFSCVTLDSLNSAFALSGKTVDAELVGMIRDGVLEARIDSKDKLLVAVRPEARSKMQTNAINVAHKYEQEAKERLRRINIVAAGLEVTGNKRQGGGGPGAATVEEALYDESARPVARATDAEA